MACSRLILNSQKKITSSSLISRRNLKITELFCYFSFLWEGCARENSESFIQFHLLFLCWKRFQMHSKLTSLYVNCLKCGCFKLLYHHETLSFWLSPLHIIWIFQGSAWKLRRCYFLAEKYLHRLLPFFAELSNISLLKNCNELAHYFLFHVLP